MSPRASDYFSLPAARQQHSSEKRQVSLKASVAEGQSWKSSRMGVHKKTRKFAQVKRIIGQRDARLKKNQDTGKTEESKKKDDDVIREA